MGPVKTKGFVVRVVPVGESDRIVDLLTESLGLVTVSVRGARRNRSPHLLTTQLFSFASFELFENKNRYRLNASELITSFNSLQQDLDRLICATHLAEVLVDATRDDAPQPAVYGLWAYSMHAISTDDDPLLTVHIAQMKLLMLIGFAPHLDACVYCGQQKAEQKSHAFSFFAGGIICKRSACLSRATDKIKLSRSVLDCLAYIQHAAISKLFQFTLDQKTRVEFIRFSESYLNHQMEKSYTKLRMLESLKGFDSVQHKE